MSQYDIVFSETDSMCCYKMTAISKVIEELGSIIVYGVEIFKIGCEKSLLSHERCVIHDISSEKDKVIQLIKKMAANKLLPIHTLDIIEDII